MKNLTMKQLFAVLTAVTMTLSLLAGCGAKKQEEPPVGLPNPLTEVSAEEMTVASGIALDAPEGAENVKYFTLKDGDATTAQVTFTYNGVDYTYRAQVTSQMEAYDMSGMHYTDWTVTEGDVAYCTATVETNKEAAAAYWLDVVPSINYTLAADKGISADELLQAAEASFSSAQGDAEPDPGFETADFEGYYEDGEGSSVTLVNAGMNVYDVTIGIYRLTEFTGEGRMEEGCVIFNVKAPDDSDVTGRFYIAEDDTCSVVFTDSKWNLLESGTAFDGFVLSSVPQLGPEDYTGHYLNGQDDTVCDSVRMTLTEPGTYQVQIDILRLASFEGEGHIMDGAVEFTVTDPNGNPMDGIFYPTAEDVYALAFTVSNWNLLESGTVMEDFVPVVD